MKMNNQMLVITFLLVIPFMEGFAVRRETYHEILCNWLCIRQPTNPDCQVCTDDSQPEVDNRDKIAPETEITFDDFLSDPELREYFADYIHMKRDSLVSRKRALEFSEGFLQTKQQQRNPKSGLVMRKRYGDFDYGIMPWHVTEKAQENGGEIQKNNNVFRYGRRK
jgi:hypothetical protein